MACGESRAALCGSHRALGFCSEEKLFSLRGSLGKELFFCCCCSPFCSSQGAVFIRNNLQEVDIALGARSFSTGK